MDRSLLHDIRNDLAVAIASVQAFIDGKLDTSRENLQEVLETLEDLDRLTTDLHAALRRQG